MSSEHFRSPTRPAPVARPRRTWRRWCLYQAGWSAIYFLLYALSIGPLYWYWWEAAFAGGSEWVFAFYGPLAVLAEFCPPFRDVINAYINWWILS
jgi:hypothetical protein